MAESFPTAAEDISSPEYLDASFRVLGRFIGLAHGFFGLGPASIESISKLDLRPPTTVIITKLGPLPTNRLQPNQLVISQLASPLNSMEIEVPARLVYP